MQALARRFQRAGGLLFIAAAAIVVLALLGLLDQYRGEFSVIQGAALAVAVLILAALWVRRRNVRVVPFSNLVTGDMKPRLDSLAAGLADQLDLELRRISRLSSGSLAAVTQPSYAYSRAAERGKKPGASHLPRLGQARLRFDQLSAAAPGAAGSLGLGTLSMGPVQVQLGWLLGTVSRWFAQVISGKVFLAGNDVVVVVDHPSGARWCSRCALEGADATTLVPSLARELGAQIASHFERSQAGAGDWRALLAVVDGIDHLERYRGTSSVASLDLADRILSRAVTDSPLYALAYYCLGNVLHESARLQGRVAEQAVVMWERALALDPGIPEAHLALGRHEMDQGEYELAELRCKQAVALLRKARRPTSPARYALADTLFRQAVHFSTQPRPACRRALTQLRRAQDEIRITRRIERLTGTPIQDLVDLDQELAEVTSAQADVCEWLAGGVYRSHRADATPWPDRLRRRQALRRAERMRRLAVRVHPEQPYYRTMLAGILGARRKPKLAYGQVVRALRLDPWAPNVRGALTTALRNSGNVETAARVAASALDVAPWDGDEWREAAELALERGQQARSAAESAAREPAELGLALAEAQECATALESVVELAGAALALNPHDPVNHELIAAALDSQGSHEWAMAFQRVADVLWDPMRQLELLGTPGDVGAAAGAGEPERSDVANDSETLRFVRDWTGAWTRNDLRALAELASRGHACSKLVANQIGRLHMRRAQWREPGRSQLMDYRAALRWFQRAAEWWRDSASSHDLLTQLPVEWQFDLADCYAELGQWSRAKTAYEAVLHRQTFSTWIRTDLEVRAETAGPAVRARAFNTDLEVRAEAAGPAVRARAFAGHGQAALCEGDLEQASIDCSEALTLEPAYAFPYRIEAEIMAERKQYDDAVARWRLYAQLAPEVSAWAEAGIADALRAQAFDERDDERRTALLQEAASAYRRALRGDGVRRPIAHAHLGRCLAELGYVSQALPQLEEAARLAGDEIEYVEVHHELAQAYAKAGWFARAEAEFRRGRDIAAAALGSAARRDGRAQSLLVASEAGNLLAWFLAEHEIQLAEAEEVAVRAVELADEARALDPSAATRETLADARDTLGWVRHRRGCHAAATRDLRAAIELSPRPFFRAHLAQVLETRASGQDDERRRESYRAAARRQWERIRDIAPGGELDAMAAQRLAHDANGGDGSGGL